MGGVHVGLIRDRGALGLHARITVAAVRPDGSIREACAGDNVTCVNGLTMFAAALVWSGIEDQAAALGVTSPTYLAPLFGAVGSGTGTAANTDVALFSELGRQTVGAGASSPATPSVNALTTWLFYFPSPSTSWTITEAGVFGQATSAPGSGTLLDHYVLGTPVTVTSPDTAILQVALSVAGS